MAALKVCFSKIVSGMHSKDHRSASAGSVAPKDDKFLAPQVEGLTPFATEVARVNSLRPH